MNEFSTESGYKMAKGKVDEYRARADHYRLVKEVKGERPSGLERLAVAIGQGLLSIGESFKRPENRPSLPTT